MFELVPVALSCIGVVFADVDNIISDPVPDVDNRISFDMFVVFKVISPVESINTDEDVEPGSLSSLIEPVLVLISTAPDPDIAVSISPFCDNNLIPAKFVVSNCIAGALLESVAS
jgi:hypothetical protein